MELTDLIAEVFVRGLLVDRFLQQLVEDAQGALGGLLGGQVFLRGQCRGGGGLDQHPGGITAVHAQEMLHAIQRVLESLLACPGLGQPVQLLAGPGQRVLPQRR